MPKQKAFIRNPRAGVAGIVALGTTGEAPALDRPRYRLQRILLPVPTTPEEFGAFLKREIDKWGRVIREQGMRAE